MPKPLALTFGAGQFTALVNVLHVYDCTYQVDCSKAYRFSSAHMRHL